MRNETFSRASRSRLLSAASGTPLGRVVLAVVLAAGALVFFLSGFVWFDLVAVRVFAFLSVPVFWELVIGLDFFFSLVVSLD